MDNAVPLCGVGLIDKINAGKMVANFQESIGSDGDIDAEQRRGNQTKSLAVDVDEHLARYNRDCEINLPFLIYLFFSFSSQTFRAVARTLPTEKAEMLSLLRGFFESGAPVDESMQSLWQTAKADLNVSIHVSCFEIIKFRNIPNFPIDFFCTLLLPTIWPRTFTCAQ
jgi:hypothetical protein